MLIDNIMDLLSENSSDNIDGIGYNISEQYRNSIGFFFSCNIPEIFSVVVKIKAKSKSNSCNKPWKPTVL
jgi:hypothetical protein